MKACFRILTVAPYRAAFPTVKVVHPVRAFSTTQTMWAKGAKKSKKEARKAAVMDEMVDSSAADIIDLGAAKTKFEAILDKFNKKATEVKMGKTSPKIFDNLDIKNNKETFKFNTVAQTSLKGRNLIITVFDPDHTKSIISAILDSDLNMNPTYDEAQGVLKVPLPPITTETKNEQAKQLKLVFEKFKSNSTNSLNSIRTDYKQKFKKLSKTNDNDKKLFSDFENLHKEYTDKLTAQFKNTEKLIMK